jgi:hypothetical protein
MAVMLPPLFLFQGAADRAREPEAAVAVVRHAAESAETQLREARSRVQPMEIQIPDGSISGYDPGPVRITAEAARKQLLDQLTSEELAPLRAYVEAGFPDPEKELKILHLRGTNLATEKSTQDVFEKILQILTRLKQLESLMIELRLAVTPGEALIELWPAALPEQKTPAKAGDLVPLYRGLYQYRVVKNGYKVIESTLDLVDRDGSTLECRLYLLNDPDGPYPCSFR